MANITKNLELTDSWQDVTTELALADTTTYLADLNIRGKLDMSNSITAMWAKTNNNTAPTDDLIPHQWVVFAGGLSPQGRFTQNANEHIWMKIIRGAATLVMTKT